MNELYFPLNINLFSSRPIFKAMINSKFDAFSILEYNTDVKSAKPVRFQRKADGTTEI